MNNSMFRVVPYGLNNLPDKVVNLFLFQDIPTTIYVFSKVASIAVLCQNKVVSIFKFAFAHVFNNEWRVNFYQEIFFFLKLVATVFR